MKIFVYYRSKSESSDIFIAIFSDVPAAVVAIFASIPGPWEGAAIGATADWGAATGAGGGAAALAGGGAAALEGAGAICLKSKQIRKHYSRFHNSDRSFSFSFVMW